MKEDRISIASPESIEFTYELAGIGSRFLANLIDTFLQIMAIGAVIGLLFLSGISLQFLNIFVTGLTSWGIAIAILSVFLIFWGYYIFFELLLNGQTPGKKAIGIRVIRDGGYPITLIEALARNLMRFVDFLPISYGLGVIVMFFNSNCKRLGDFAAGTIVVKERKTPLPAVIITGEKGKAVDCNVRLLSENDYGLIREFLGRKNKFDPKVQTEFARKLSLQLMKKLNLEELPASVDSYEEFLESVASQYRDREAWGAEGTLLSIKTELKDAQVSPKELDRIIFVGGSTRSPLVSGLIEREFGITPRHEINPDLCVAMGAAIQGAIIDGSDVDRILVEQLGIWISSSHQF